MMNDDLEPTAIYIKNRIDKQLKKTCNNKSNKLKKKELPDIQPSETEVNNP